MNFKTTIMILTAFILLAGAYFLFFQPDPETESKSDQQKIRVVYALDKDKIRQIRLSFKDESYQPLTLAKNPDGVWQLTDPFTADADEPKIGQMLRDLLEKKVKRTLDLEETDLASYGLQPPKVQIELWTEGESPTKVFLIGNKTVDYSVYAKEKSELQVFLIESSALDDLTKSPSDLRSRNIFNFSLDAVSEISVQVSGQANDIHCRKRDTGEWDMTRPVSAKADFGEIESILSALNTLKATAFEADGQVNLAKYGLDKPRIRVSLQLADNSTQALIISEADTSEHIHVMRPYLPSIYSVNKEIYAQLHKAVFDLRDKRVIDFQRTATNRFELRQGNSKIVCQKNANSEWEITEPVALKAEGPAVADLLFQVDALKAIAFVDDAPKNLQPYGLDVPSIQVSFMVPNAETVILRVGDIKGDNVYVKSENAKPVFLVKKDLLDLLGMGVAGLRNKNVLNFNIDDATKFSLTHGDVNLTCQKQRINWRLTHPVQENAANGVVNGAIYQIYQLTVEKFLAELPDAATTGLDTPEAQFSVTLKDRTEYTLQIGKPADNEHHYGRLRHLSGTIFLIKKELAEQLKMTVEDLRMRSDGA